MDQLISRGDPMRPTDLFHAFYNCEQSIAKRDVVGMSIVREFAQVAMVRVQRLCPFSGQPYQHNVSPRLTRRVSDLKCKRQTYHSRVLGYYELLSVSKSGLDGLIE